MPFDVNVSPCRGCDSEEEIKDNIFDIEKQCMLNCIPLMCWQTAINRAEKIGVPKLGTCAICRSPLPNGSFCDQCLDRAKAEVARRITARQAIKSDEPTQKRVSADVVSRKYQWITKRSKSAKCEMCGKTIPVGRPAMARNMSKVRGNYRYTHVECFEAAQDQDTNVSAEKKTVAVTPIGRKKKGGYTYIERVKRFYGDVCEICGEPMPPGEKSLCRRSFRIWVYAHYKCVFGKGGNEKKASDTKKPSAISVKAVISEKPRKKSGDQARRVHVPKVRKKAIESEGPGSCSIGSP